MKLLRTIYSFILLSAFLTGCNIYDDQSDCPGNVVLLFDYPYNGNQTTFLDRVSRVNVGIYGMDGTLVERRQIEDNDLEKFQGMTVNLPVGEYKAVFWGNAYDNTSINWNDERVYNSRLYDANPRISSDDDLTFSQLTFSVKVADVDSIPVHFEPAYVTMQVAVIDNDGSLLPDLTGGVVLNEEELPYVDVRNLPDEVYDFNMQNCDTEGRDFYPQWVQQPAGRTRAGATIWTANTYVHRMSNDNPVVVSLFDNAINNTTLNSTVLKDYITANPNYAIVPQKEQTIYISYVIEKKGDDIDVTLKPLPWWEITVVPNT
ncbi:MAG: FimB/Mfa2 family fimbrial subunit [Prevotellaceae bacterium]|jgi:hypothetical protein|nr:FimB/Mfa2 family fimbrial subunit [Prevotellaceae bacterium]